MFSFPSIRINRCLITRQQRRLVFRPCVFFSSSSSSSSSYTVKVPKPKLKSWESGAKLVKNTHVENQYLDHIRDIHDPSLHLKTIEDELKGTIGKALGKQGQKIVMYTKLMASEREKYNTLIKEKQRQEQESDNNKELDTHLQNELQNIAKQYNLYRKDCLHARWELVVHRQAVGFIVGNHKYVIEKFPIADALPDEDGDNINDNGTANGDNKKQQQQTKKFGDQLDWWQRIGRWR